MVLQICQLKLVNCFFKESKPNFPTIRFSYPRFNPFSYRKRNWVSRKNGERSCLLQEASLEKPKATYKHIFKNKVIIFRRPKRHLSMHRHSPSLAHQNRSSKIRFFNHQVLKLLKKSFELIQQRSRSLFSSSLIIKSETCPQSTSN